ncbi:MAG: hypothetical protein V3G42_08580 [Oscillospiraceae bacterium]
MAENTHQEWQQEIDALRQLIELMKQENSELLKEARALQEERDRVLESRQCFNEFNATIQTIKANQETFSQDLSELRTNMETALNSAGTEKETKLKEISESITSLKTANENNEKMLQTILDIVKKKPSGKSPESAQKHMSAKNSMRGKIEDPNS